MKFALDFGKMWSGLRYYSKFTTTMLVAKSYTVSICGQKLSVIDEHSFFHLQSNNKLLVSDQILCMSKQSP